MESHKLTRREVLRTGAATLAIPYIITSEALAQDGRPGANDRLDIGIIGLGGRAQYIARTCGLVPEIRIVAVCDCFLPQCAAFINSVGKDQTWNSYENARVMYEKENLDAVMVETTTHARGRLATEAMRAGLDVYIEKPMCLTVAEGRRMVKAARKYKRVTQVGTQQRSMPINNWASDLVRNGALGKIEYVLAPNFMGPLRWTDQPGQPMPEGGGANWWDVWTDQAVFRPYHPQLHRGWAQWWDYDAGGLSFGVSGWGTHAYDQIQRALGTDETGPVEVVLEEPMATKGMYEDPADVAEGTGPRAKVTMRMANGIELRMHRDRLKRALHGLGATFYGEKGWIEIERNQIASDPPDLVDRPDNPGPNQKDETQYHVENWVKCIRTRERCNADIEYGQRANTLCHLVNIARDVGDVSKVLRWDPVAERFTNCDEGNAMLSRPRRGGYDLPPL